MDATIRFYRSFSILLNFLAVLYLSWFVRIEAEGGDTGLSVQYYLNMLWLISPYFLLAILAVRAKQSRTRALIILIGSLVIIVCGAIMLFDAYWLRDMSQVGTALKVLPLYQWIVCAAILGINGLDKWVRSRLGPGTSAKSEDRPVAEPGSSASHEPAARPDDRE